MLFLAPNHTGPPPTDLVVPTLQQILVVRGTQKSPVKNVKVEGINFRDAQAVYEEQVPHCCRILCSPTECRTLCSSACAPVLLCSCAPVLLCSCAPVLLCPLLVCVHSCRLLIRPSSGRYRLAVTGLCTARVPSMSREPKVSLCQMACSRCVCGVLFVHEYCLVTLVTYYVGACC